MGVAIATACVVDVLWFSVEESDRMGLTIKADRERVRAASIIRISSTRKAPVRRPAGGFEARALRHSLPRSSPPSRFAYYQGDF